MSMPLQFPGFLLADGGGKRINGREFRLLGSAGAAGREPQALAV
jgi:hypothetical protein